MDHTKISRKPHEQHDDWDNVHNQLLAVQKKSMEISDPDDGDEKEADAVARKVINGESAEIHGTSGTINRSGEGSVEATPEFQSKLESKKGTGQSLDENVRGEMESKMGADFSGVKIHTGHEASQMSESINAKAFTHGQDIFFRSGQYDTHAKQGKELLAHELTHTVQQKGNVSRKIQRSTMNLTQEDIMMISQIINDELKKDSPEPETIMMQLQKLGRVKDFIDVFNGDYNTRFKSADDDMAVKDPFKKNSLYQQVNRKLSDKKYDQSRALIIELLTSNTQANAYVDLVPKEDAQHETNAGLISTALQAIPFDATAIYRVLLPYERVKKSLDQLKKIYKKKYGNKKTELEDDIRAKLSGEELRFTLYLLNGLESNIRKYGIYSPQIVTGPDALTDKANIKAGLVSGNTQIAGGGNISAYLNATLPAFKKDHPDPYKNTFIMEYKGAQGFDTHWLQFIWMELIAYYNGTPTPVAAIAYPSGGAALPDGKISYTVDQSNKQIFVDTFSKEFPFYDTSAQESGVKKGPETGAARSHLSTRMIDYPHSYESIIYETLNKGAEKVVLIDHFTTFLVRDDQPLYQTTFRKEATYEPRADKKKISKWKNHDMEYKEPTKEENILESGGPVDTLGDFHDTLAKYYPHYDFIR